MTSGTAASLRLNPPQAAVDLDRRLVVLIQGTVEPRRVDDEDVGAVAHPQVAGVDAVEVGELAGEPVHGLGCREERPAGDLCVAHVLEQPQPEVVEGHVAQVGAGVGEAHLHVRALRHLPQHLRAVVGDGGEPAHRGAVLEHDVEEGVDRVQAAALEADLAEGLADQRLVGAGDDLGVEEVAVPDPGAVLGLVVLAEGAAVLLGAEQFLARGLFLQVQSGRAGPELLEDHQVDAVGVDLEGHRQVDRKSVV